VVDTHAWVWWLTAPDRLSVAARQAVGAADTVFVPAIACWEVALLVFRGHLELSMPIGEWFETAFRDSRFRIAPLTPSIAIRGAALDWPHRDPADRLIVATALELGAPLATRDERIRSSAIPGLVTAW
jgi:PIN domain nuclease of toxin-antitoxin system